MFVRLRDFKRLIKEAYTGAGLYVARRGKSVAFRRLILGDRHDERITG